jgi:hypothetical protein
MDSQLVTYIDIILQAALAREVSEALRRMIDERVRKKSVRD